MTDREYLSDVAKRILLPSVTDAAGRFFSREDYIITDQVGYILTEMEALLRAKGVEEELIAPICGFEGVYRPMLKKAWTYMDENWGGAVGYLKGACGVSDEELDAIRARYIEE